MNVKTHLVDLWVLKEYGIVIFSKSSPLNPEDQCLGGLISALYSFTQIGFNETLFQFTTDKCCYYDFSYLFTDADIDILKRYFKIYTRFKYLFYSL